MLKIIFTLTFIFTFYAFASPSDLIRPTGEDIFKNCSSVINTKTELNDTQQFKKTMMSSLCLTAVNNTYQSIRGPMMAFRDVDIVCYQDYYQLAEKSYLAVLTITLDYIKNHPSTRDANLSIIMAVMMNERYPIPATCKK